MSDCVVWFLGREQNMRGLQVCSVRVRLDTSCTCARVDVDAPVRWDSVPCHANCFLSHMMLPADEPCFFRFPVAHTHTGRKQLLQ